MSDSKLWQEQARKLGGEDLVTTIEQMAHDLNTIKATVGTATQQITEVKKDTEAMKATIQDLTGAFPGGDLDGHNRAHQLMIERNQELRRLRVAIQEKTISGLIWAFLVFLALCIFSYIGKPPPQLPPLPPIAGGK